MKRFVSLVHRPAITAGLRGTLFREAAAIEHHPFVFGMITSALGMHPIVPLSYSPVSKSTNLLHAMPFTPNKPAANSPNSSAKMRTQLNGLKDLIDAMQVGITNVAVDAVNTAPPRTPANVGVNLSGTELHLPQGNEGPTGATGQPARCPRVISTPPC